MSNILETCDDLSEQISIHLTVLDAQRVKLEALKTSSKVLERLQKRTVEYLLTCLSDLIVFSEFLLELQNNNYDFNLIEELLDREEKEF
jgi:hypothetical protein